MPCRSGERVRLLNYALCLFFLTLGPLAADAQTLDLSAMSDRLRDAEKSAQTAEVKQILRTARRALDHAEEQSERGDRPGTDSELRAAGAALEKAAPLLRDESATLRADVQSVRDSLAAALEPTIVVTRQDVETSAGLHVATFDTLQGTVTVNLPDDMAAGDTISGTVIADAKGSTPEEQKRNQDSLSGTVVEMEKQKTSPSEPGGRGKWLVPTIADVAIPLILRDRQGRTIGKVTIPVARAPKGQAQPAIEKTKPSAATPSAGAVGAFQLPSTGQTGRPVAITGPFDGDFATSDVSVAGTPIDVLAESPRKLVARAPVGVIGMVAMEVSERLLVTRCEYRNLDVKLFAPKVDLKSGERTTMTVTVDGAAGMKQRFPLWVVNKSPTVVRVDKGDKQTIEVDPRKLTNGSFVVTRGLTGVRPGGFNIQASVSPDALPPARCTTVAQSSPKPNAPPPPASVASSSPAPERSVPSITDVFPPREAPPTVESYRPSVTAAVADDPERLRTSHVAVHTGARWRWLHGGNTIEVFRDNPPMTGVADLAPNSVTVISETRNLSPFWQRNASLAAWRNDLFFAGSDGHTFTDSENDGLLGVVPAGPLPRENTAARVRWHTNGLQLNPGTAVELYLRRRGDDDVPQAVADASGSVRLDPNTIIVGVAVAVIVEEGVQEPIVDRPMAELWFDGRTADRRQRISLGGLNIQLVLDRDPHPGWSAERLDAPNDGRRLIAMGQDPDGVWSYCGENFGQNIQFRLVRFARVQAATGGPACALAASQGRSEALRNCVVSWGAELQRVTGDLRPAITIAIPYAYPTAGVAQAWSGGALVSQEALSGGYGRNTIAHEIGHVLGWGSNLFNDGVFRNNLMSGGAERTLLREQCEVAYRAAAAYSLFPRR